MILHKIALAAVLGLLTAQAGFAADRPDELLRGCSDVPEAIELAGLLRLRQQAVDRSLADLDRRRAEIETARAALTETLNALRRAQGSAAEVRNARQDGKKESIARLIAVYDAMKPAEAARVLSAMPPDFAAEILARVTPDNGARIIAAIEPTQAAILTARMGTRNVGRN